MDNKAKVIEFKMEQIKDALLKLGVIGICMPQVVEVHTNKDGFIDIPIKVRAAV